MLAVPHFVSVRIYCILDQHCSGKFEPCYCILVSFGPVLAYNDHYPACSCCFSARTHDHFLQDRDGIARYRDYCKDLPQSYMVLDSDEHRVVVDIQNDL